MIDSPAGAICSLNKWRAAARCSLRKLTIGRREREKKEEKTEKFVLLSRIFRLTQHQSCFFFSARFCFCIITCESASSAAEECKSNRFSRFSHGSLELASVENDRLKSMSQFWIFIQFLWSLASVRLSARFTKLHYYSSRKSTTSGNGGKLANFVVIRLSSCTFECFMTFPPTTANSQSEMSSAIYSILNPALCRFAHLHFRIIWTCQNCIKIFWQHNTNQQQQREMRECRVWVILPTAMRREQCADQPPPTGSACHSLHRKCTHVSSQKCSNEI